jgi:acetylornithine deacetylase
MSEAQALDDQTRTAIMTAVDEGFDEQIDFTSELVKFPSVRGAEQTAQDFMARELGARGYGVDRWKIELDDISHLPGFSPVHVNYDNAYNTVGSYRSENPKGHSLILNGHIDVVPVGPADMWARPPFEPYVEGDWLYGRGSGDMKAGIAECVYAMDALKRLGYAPAGDVYVQSVIEEECTGNGALACLQRGYKADAALIPEPLGEQLVRAQIGVIWFQVKLRGRPVHVLEAASGANAIEAAFPIIQALHGLEHKWNKPENKHEAYAHVDHPINLNIGRIAGGDWPSSVPAWCTFDVRVAIYPDQDLDEARREIEDTIRGAAQGDRFLANNPPEVLYHGFLAEGYVLSGADEAEEILNRAHKVAYGEDLTELATTATTDARFFGLYADTPGLVYGPIAENIHGFDERVSLESVRRNTQAMAMFIAEWCGLNSA